MISSRRRIAIARCWQRGYSHKAMLREFGIASFIMGGILVIKIFSGGILVIKVFLGGSLVICRIFFKKILIFPKRRRPSTYTDARIPHALSSILVHFLLFAA